MNNLSNTIRNAKLLSGFCTNGTNCGVWGAVPTRNTYILKRRLPLNLAKKNQDPTSFRPLRARNYEYELIENTVTQKRPEVEVILKEYVDGLGLPGDVVKVKRNVAYNKLLLTGLADYPTPEAIEKAKIRAAKSTESAASSKFVPLGVGRKGMPMKPLFKA